MLQNNYLHLWLLIYFLFHCFIYIFSFLHLLHYDFASIIDIDTLLSGLAAEFMAAHVVPAAKVYLACFGVERADSCGLLVIATY